MALWTPCTEHYAEQDSIHAQFLIRQPCCASTKEYTHRITEQEKLKKPVQTACKTADASFRNHHCNLEQPNLAIYSGMTHVIILHGSSQAERYFKPCVNGDTSFLWEGPKFDPLQNKKTPERIRMKFCTVDYVLEISSQNKFGDDRSSGGFWVNM